MSYSVILIFVSCCEESLLDSHLISFCLTLLFFFLACSSFFVCQFWGTLTVLESPILCVINYKYFPWLFVFLNLPLVYLPYEKRLYVYIVEFVIFCGLGVLSCRFEQIFLQGPTECLLRSFYDLYFHCKLQVHLSSYCCRCEVWSHLSFQMASRVQSQLPFWGHCFSPGTGYGSLDRVILFLMLPFWMFHWPLFS